MRNLNYQYAAGWVFKRTCQAAIILVMIELAMWMFGATFTEFVIREDAAGYKYLGNQERVYFNKSENTLVRFSSNAHGYRDGAWPTKKRQNERIIAVIGDSVVASIETHARNRFTERLARKYEAIGSNVRVVNVGVGGQNFVNYLNAAAYLRRELDPDYYIVMITGADDFSPDFQSTIFDGELLEYDSRGSELVITRTPLTASQKLYRKILAYARMSWVIRQSVRGVNFLRNTLTNRLARGFKPKREEKLTRLTCPTHINLPQKHYELAERILLDIKETTGPRLILALSPMAEEVRRNVNISVCNIDRVKNWFADFARNNQIDPLFLIDALDRVPVDSLFLDRTHYSDKGHEVISMALYEKLRSRMSEIGD